ncbi:MAG: RAD55 family ATPase [Thermoplasmata archaeon]
MMSESQTDVYKVAQEFSLGDDFTYGVDVKLRGRSGIEHKFDLVLTSKEDERNKIAVLQDVSEDLISDIMEFNAIARDCGIQLKAIATDRELNKSELNLARVCNITVVKSNYEKATNSIIGIQKFDEDVGRLIRKGSVYMISGGPGTGKTAICSQFLAEGAKRGEKGMIILTDRQGRNFISQIETFSHGFRNYYANGVIEVLEISDRIMKLKANVTNEYQSMISYIRTLTNQLKTLVAEFEVTRLVIDPVTPLIIPDNDFLNLFFRAISIPQAYTLVTSGIGKSDTSAFGLEQSFVSGLIKLEDVGNGSEVKKASIVKMNGGGYNSSPFLFKITTKGIVPYDEDSSTSSGPLFNQVIL